MLLVNEFEFSTNTYAKRSPGIRNVFIPARMVSVILTPFFVCPKPWQKLGPESSVPSASRQ